MTSPEREPPLSHRIYVTSQSPKDRLDLERKILAATFKQCFEAGDSEGAAFAHKGLCAIIQQQLFSGDGSSSGSVIPASVWQQAGTAEAMEAAAAAADVQADPTAPLNYLDFGDDTSEVPAAVPLDPSTAETEQIVLTPSQAIKMKTMYQILGVSQVASFEEIHAHYLRLMRRLLQSRYSENPTITDFREFREVLRAVCVAHDILKDPITRTDYDLRQVGLRNDAPADEGKPLTERRRLMLGELLECAEILQGAELQIALDMHKAEPGMQFGEFLVTANFLNQEELDCTLLAQRLISAGKITVNQFRTAMYRMRDEKASFFDTLMVEGWLSAADIFDPSSLLWDMPSETGNYAQPGVEDKAPRAIPPEWNDVPEELRQTADEPANGSENGHEEPEPAGVAAWTERDALAETQSIDLSAFRKEMVRTDED
jgi:hypothetical protein